MAVCSELAVVAIPRSPLLPQVLDVSQVMGAPSPIEAPHGEAPAFRRGVKTEMRDLNPEMQEDDWMTAYQGGEEQVALQSHLQAQLQAQLQLL